MPQQKTDVIRIIPAGAPTNIGENIFVNCYPESVENSLTQVKRAYCVKRKGLSETLLTISSVSGEARGTYYWDDTGYTFAVYGDKVYSFNGTTPSTITTLTTTTGPVGFTVVSYGDTNKLFFCDGQKGYLVDSATPSTVVIVDGTSVTDYVITNAGTGYTSAPTVSFTGGGGSGLAATAIISSGAVVGLTFTNYGSGYTSAPTVVFTGGGGSNAAATVYLNAIPVPHVPFPQSMDGYLFLAKEGTSSVYNCQLGDYQVWKQSQYLYVNQYPGNILALVKQQNYIIAMKQDAMEYLYNAGNTTNSPLGRTTQAASNYGCAQPATTCALEDSVLFVAEAAGGGFGVWLVENFKETKVSTEFIDNFLNNNYGLYSGTKGIYYLRSFVVRVDGHKFYVLTEHGNTTNNRALVYDIEERFWSFWDSQVDTTTKKFIGVAATNRKGLPIIQAVVNSSNEGKLLFFPNSNGQGDYNDAGTVYYSFYNSPVTDMDNRYRKRFTRVEVVGNAYSYSNPVTINYSDTNLENLDKVSNTSWQVDSQQGKQAYLTQLGTSRYRIWQIGQNIDAPCRWENIEIFYTQGVH